MQEDHKSIVSVIENFFRFVSHPDSPDAAKEYISTQRLINEVLKDHFTLEETQLFPSLLANRPSAEMTQSIAKLRQEHASLLEEVRLFREKSGDTRNPAKHREELWRATAHLITLMENHITDEERLFESFS